MGDASRSVQPHPPSWHVRRGARSPIIAPRSLSRTHPSQRHAWRWDGWWFDIRARACSNLGSYRCYRQAVSLGKGLRWEPPALCWTADAPGRAWWGSRHTPDVGGWQRGGWQHVDASPGASCFPYPGRQPTALCGSLHSVPGSARTTQTGASLESTASPLLELKNPTPPHLSFACCAWDSVGD